MPPPVEQACATVGLDGRDVQVMHLRANAVYHLPRVDAVLRLRHTRGSREWLHRLQTSVDVTRWFADQGFPTVVPLDVDQPITVDGWTATFWRFEPFDTEERAAPSTLGHLLYRLHTLPSPPVDLPETDPLGSLPVDLDHDEFLPSERREWLQAQADDIRRRYPNVVMPHGQGLIHGDAHTGNLFGTGEKYLLGDWDSVSHGPRIQDLVPTLVDVRRFGRSGTEWVTVCKAYGIDPSLEEHPALRLLVQARELRSLAAYIRTAARPDIKAELDKRLRTLIDDTDEVWRAL